MNSTVASGDLRKYVVAVGGTLALVAIAAVTFQLLKPSSAFSDTKAAKPDSKETKAATNYLGRVNNELISYDEVAQEAIRRHGEEVLENLINRKIIEQACIKKGIEVSTEEINGEILKIAKKFNLSVEQWLAMLQSERKVTAAQYKQDIIWPMLALRKLAGGQVKLTKKDLEEAFQRNYGPRVKARILVLDNQRRGTEVWEQVRKKPSEFEQFVFKHSVDPSSRPLGGAVPPIRRYSGNKVIEDQAFALKEGEISGLIQVDVNQFVIIKCEGFTDQVVASIDDVIGVLKEELQEEKVQESVATVFKNLKAEARVDNYLTGVKTGAKKSLGSPAAQIDQTSAQEPAAKPARVNPAAGTAPRGSAPARSTPKATER